MPILDMILGRRPRSPSGSAAAPRPASGRSPPSLSVAASAAIVSSASRGQIASAPKPSRQAKWCVSRGSSLATTSDARVRSPRATRRWCTAPTASSAGIGARSSPRRRRRTGAAPRRRATAASASAREPLAGRRAGPRSRANVASSAVGASASSADGKRKKLSSSISRAASGPRVRSGARAPSSVRRRHHEPLAQVVDRRVRDLREALLEVRGSGRARLASGGERGVVAHRRGRLVRGRPPIGRRMTFSSSRV